MGFLEMQPIGFVSNERKTPIDDNWDKVESKITLNADFFSEQSLQGLQDFSHCEIIFYFHKVESSKLEFSSRHPRGNKEWPKVGIFSQRAKDRPNQLGLTTCKIIRVEGLDLFVNGLDAIDGTPVIDLKPVMKEFLPRGEVIQPQWASELMKEYW